MSWVERYRDRLEQAINEARAADPYDKTVDILSRALDWLDEELQRPRREAELTREEARAFLATEQLPPWTCCGGKGPHREGCAYRMPAAVVTDASSDPSVSLIGGDMVVFPTEAPERYPHRACDRALRSTHVGDACGACREAAQVRVCGAALGSRLCALLAGHTGWHDDGSAAWAPEHKSVAAPARRTGNQNTVRVGTERICGDLHPHAEQLGFKLGCLKTKGHAGAHVLANGRSWLPQSQLERGQG